MQSVRWVLVVNGGNVAGGGVSRADLRVLDTVWGLAPALRLSDTQWSQIVQSNNGSRSTARCDDVLMKSPVVAITET